MSINEYQISFLTCVMVYIWTRTDALYEYFSFFHISSFEEYLKFKNSMPIRVNFCDFLAAKKPSFFIKLITCPICLSIYLTCLLYFIFLICKIPQANLGFSIYFSWILFFLIEKLNSK